MKIAVNAYGKEEINRTKKKKTNCTKPITWVKNMHMANTILHLLLK